jgi:hypothetical protein
MGFLNMHRLHAMPCIDSIPGLVLGLVCTAVMCTY